MAICLLCGNEEGDRHYTCDTCGEAAMRLAWEHASDPIHRYMADHNIAPTSDIDLVIEIARVNNLRR